MLLHELVATTETVGSTSSRLAKIDALGALLSRLDPDEIAPAMGFLVAKPRQGRLGVGWRGVAALEVVHAAEPTLTVLEVDAALERLAAASGSGSVGTRRAELDGLAGRATAGEWDFLTRVILGELRTGALEGVLLDAIARASGEPAPTVRRAVMLSGDLGETARIALTGAEGELAEVGLRVGRPVLPMLASTAASAADAMTTAAGAASVEFKLDGARIQVHRRRRRRARLHPQPRRHHPSRARDRRDGAVAPGGRGHPRRRDAVAGCDGGPRPFQDTMSRFGSETHSATELRPWFFDVLHVDGRDLIDEPLAVRLAELERIASDHGASRAS